MPRTPDRTPGPALEEELQLEDNGANPSVVGALTNNAGSLLAQDSIGIFNLRSGSGLTSTTHNSLRQLIHFLDDGPGDGFASGAFKETTLTGIKVTNETWYDDNTKAKKLLSLDVTYTGLKPTTEVWKMYDVDGSTVLITLTDAIVYTGIHETSRTRTWA